MNNFTHILLTRFNVLSKDWINKPDEQWLNERIKLFEAFCYPSVQNQTNQNFIWMVFFDKDSPQILKNRINNRYKKYSNFIPIYIEYFELDIIKKLVAKRLSADYLITTRLDNDDAININYIDTIQKLFNNQTRTVLNFNYGYVLDANNYKLYKRNHYINAFCTLIEKSENFNTVWIRDHRELNTLFRLKTIKAKPYWLQIIHSKNLSNSVRADSYRVKIPPDFENIFSINGFHKINKENKLNMVYDKTIQIFPYFFRIVLRPLKRILVDISLFFKGKEIKYGRNFLVK